MGQVSEFGKTFLFVLGGIAFAGVGFLLNQLLAPHKPNPIKNSSYECGEEVIGTAQIQFNARFYVVGLLFLIFEAEIILLFPWAAVFTEKTFLQTHSNWIYLAAIEVLLFIVVLALGLIYVWVNGDLDWQSPRFDSPVSSTSAPLQLYELFNQQQLKHEQARKNP